MKSFHYSQKPRNAKQLYSRWDRVEAYWPDDDNWYPARVIKVKGNGVYLIRFDGFDEKYLRSTSRMRVRKSTNVDGGEWQEEEITEHDQDSMEEPEELQMFPYEYHPDLSFTLLQRIKRSEIASLELQNKINFKADGCRILASALSLNTSITSLDLWGTNIGAGASLFIPAFTHLHELTYLRLSITDLQSQHLRQLCSALPHLTAMTELVLVTHDSGNDLIQKLDDEDGARICCAAAAAGLTRLINLDLGRGIIPLCVANSEEWIINLGLPQPPDDFLLLTDFTGLVHFMMSNDKAAFLESYHPDLPLKLLQRIERSDPKLTKLDMRQKELLEHGWRILARSISLNTCITSLNLQGTNIGPGAALLIPAVAHLTAMTDINLGWSLPYSGTKLNEDDGARIFCAAAAAGMTRLKTLDLSAHDLTPYSFTGCETWMQLKLPQKLPDDFFVNCMEYKYNNGQWHWNYDYARFVSYLANEDDGALNRAMLFEMQGHHSAALSLHEDRLLKRKCTLGGDHPRTKEAQYMRDMCVSSVLGYRSALSMSSLMAAELQQLHTQVGVLSVSQCFRTHGVKMPLKERLRARCGGGVGLLVMRLAVEGKATGRAQEKNVKRVIKTILMRVYVMHAARRLM